jgi:uncharacterized protein
MDVSEFTVYNVYINGEDFLVVLKEAGNQNRYLPIVVGAFEANGILMKLESYSSDRPFTYDTFFSILDSMQVRMDRLLIHEMRDGIFYSTIYLELPGSGLTVFDIRPSDGIALALRFNSPIMVSEDLLLKTGADKMMNETIQSFLQAGIDRENPDNPSETNPDMENFLFNEDWFSPAEEGRLKKLKLQLKNAVSEELYEEAARIRDEILKFNKPSDIRSNL